MWPMDSFKKMGRVRRAFAYAGLGWVGFNLSGPLVIAPVGDQTDHLVRTIDARKDTLRDLAGSHLTILFPEQRAAKAYALTQTNPDLYERLAEGTVGTYYEFFGFQPAQYLVGPNSMLSVATMGLRGPWLQCTVFTPSDRLTMETIRSTLLPIHAPTQVTHLPGTLAEYRRLFLYHEAVHCRDGLKHGAAAEYNADKKSMQAYLDDGGDPAVVRSLIFMRVLNAMGNHIAYPDPDDQNEEAMAIKEYIMGPTLAHDFLGGPALPLERASQAHHDAAHVLRTYAQNNRQDSFDMIMAPLRHAAIIAILSDPDANLSPDVRILLEANRNAYEFFTTPPGPAAKAVKTPPAPRPNI
ncbi:hypothetical protein [Micavibrio aeruginosavorus]|uniref:Uncharacterized protein n=1 Tax=Micavibrio aeruginosavorus EPB TaxID=349215 RepID=M4VLK8_9BACT|nr:hypothetical protein [Micavibrio aeruginosavorus]AGH98986.1 hypothetical protein A11S_2190 [Micavibrio aeruginosavorus EPB]